MQNSFINGMAENRFPITSCISQKPRIQVIQENLRKFRICATIGRRVGLAMYVLFANWLKQVKREIQDSKSTRRFRTCTYRRYRRGNRGMLTNFWDFFETLVSQSSLFFLLRDVGEQHLPFARGSTATIEASWFGADARTNRQIRPRGTRRHRIFRKGTNAFELARTLRQSLALPRLHLFFVLQALGRGGRCVRKKVYTLLFE